MSEEIKKIAEAISSIIKNDAFTANIKPDYLKKAVCDYPSRNGKKLRPALFFWCFGICGGQITPGIEKCAAALEIWHNWTLVHDDIIDGDTMRRNMPCSHILLAEEAEIKFSNAVDSDTFGRNMALLCGDLQQGWAVDILIRGASEAGIDPALALQMVRHLEYCGNIELVSGEALDVELAARKIEDISTDEVMQMIDLKTGALFRCACELGAMAALGKNEGRKYEKISSFAKNLGRAFQLQDDLLGIFGNAATLGKNIGSDLRERKPTILLIKTLEKCDNHSKKIMKNIIGKKDLTSADLESVRCIMQNTRAYSFVKNEITRSFNCALNDLNDFPMNNARLNLEELIQYLLTRQK